jgi:formamidopyrimidine-DNA glycosylase
MPELPEVETIRIGLNKLLPGKTVKAVNFDWQKSFPNAQPDAEKFLIGATITDVKRRAKVLIIDLDSGYSLIIHLKMTGQLVFRSNDDKQRFGAGHPTRSLVDSLPDKSTHVTLDLADSKLFFNDQRKFGWVRLVPMLEIPLIDFFKKVGPEPLADDFKPKDFIDRLYRRKKSKIKPVLLDQTVIAGVGNIYADESLFAAGIHPETVITDIKKTKLELLFKELQSVLRLSIEKGGSTDKNYVDAEGKKGSYLTFAKVFRRENRPCTVCGATIEKIRVAGRGTHICPNCQKRVKS